MPLPNGPWVVYEHMNDIIVTSGENNQDFIDIAQIIPMFTDEANPENRKAELELFKLFAGSKFLLEAAIPAAMILSASPLDSKNREVGLNLLKAIQAIKN